VSSNLTPSTTFYRDRCDRARRSQIWAGAPGGAAPSEKINHIRDAGAAAGRRWAARNESRLERLRIWWTSRPIDAVDRFAIYATCLTD
jgi:hypothetical protein